MYNQERYGTPFLVSYVQNVIIYLSIFMLNLEKLLAILVLKFEQFHFSTCSYD